jgi:uncharacterized protein
MPPLCTQARHARKLVAPACPAVAWCRDRVHGRLRRMSSRPDGTGPSPEHDRPNGASPDRVESRLFLWWGRALVRHRWVVIAATAVTTALAAWSAAAWTTVETGIGEVSLNVAGQQATLEEFQATFGRDASWVVVVEAPVFDLRTLARLRALEDELEALALPGDGGELEPVVDDAYSLLDAYQVRFEAGEPVVDRFFEPMPTAAELEATRAEVLGDPMLVGQLVDAAGEHAIVVVEAADIGLERQGAFLDAVRRIITRRGGPGFALSLAGEPALLAVFNELLITDVPRLILITVVLLVVLLALFFRSVPAVIAPLLVVAVSGVDTFGVMAVVGLPVTMVTTIIPIMLFYSGVGGSVHLIDAFRRARAGGASSGEAVALAFSAVGVPMFFTAATTMVGLVCSGQAGIGIIQDMGTSAAIGVALATIQTYVLLPALLSFVGHGLDRAAEGSRRVLSIEHLIERCAAAVGISGRGESPRRRFVVIGVAAVLTVIALAGMTRLKLGYDPLRRLPESTIVHDGFAAMDEHLGGTNTISLLVEGRGEHGLADVELLGALGRLVESIRSYRDPEAGAIVGPSAGYLSMLMATRRSLRGGREAEYRLPASQAEADEIVATLRRAPRSLLGQAVSADFSKARITLRIRHVDALAYEPLTERIDRDIRRLVPRSANVRATGSVYVDMAISNLMTRSLATSFIWAFVVISVLMILVLRDVKLGLLAMVPNVLPIILVLGVMGFAGIRSDIDTMLVGSIAMGIVVDDTIHIMHRFRLGVLRGVDGDAAMAHAMLHVGRAVMSTNTVIVLGFLVLLASALANIRVFGLLVALIAVVALVADLFLTPALIGAACGGARRAAASGGRP